MVLCGIVKLLSFFVFFSDLRKDFQPYGSGFCCRRFRRSPRVSDDVRSELMDRFGAVWFRIFGVAPIRMGTELGWLEEEAEVTANNRK